MNLHELTCPECGCGFAIPQAMFDAVATSGVKFFCPNGHQLEWRRKPLEKQIKEKDEEIEQLKKELTALKCDKVAGALDGEAKKTWIEKVLNK